MANKLTRVMLSAHASDGTLDRLTVYLRSDRATGGTEDWHTDMPIPPSLAAFVADVQAFADAHASEHVDAPTGALAVLAQERARAMADRDGAIAMQKAAEEARAKAEADKRSADDERARIDEEARQAADALTAKRAELAAVQAAIDAAKKATGGGGTGGGGGGSGKG